jgi:hypothetical protein
VYCRVDRHIADQHDRVRNGNTDHHSQRDQEATRIEFHQPRRESAIFSAQGSPVETECERAKKSKEQVEPDNVNADEILVLKALAIRIRIFA